MLIAFRHEQLYLDLHSHQNVRISVGLMQNPSDKSLNFIIFNLMLKFYLLLLPSYFTRIRGIFG